MRTLLLMRHAEAAPASSGGDHDRVLTPGGLVQATAAGRALARRGIVPDVALVSTARRTQQTFAALAAELPEAPDMRPERDLYNADPETILALLRAEASDTATVMVIAHNPGIGSLAMALARSRGQPAIRSFATATIAIFEFTSEDWAPGTAGLRDVVVTPVGKTP